MNLVKSFAVVLINRDTTWDELIAYSQVFALMPGSSFSLVMKLFLKYYNKLITLYGQLVVINKNIFPRTGLPVLIYTGSYIYNEVDNINAPSNSKNLKLYFRTPGIHSAIIMEFQFSDYIKHELDCIDIKSKDPRQHDSFYALCNYICRYFRTEGIEYSIVNFRGYFNITFAQYESTRKVILNIAKDLIDDFSFNYTRTKK